MRNKMLVLSFSSPKPQKDWQSEDTVKRLFLQNLRSNSHMRNGSVPLPLNGLRQCALSSLLVTSEHGTLEHTRKRKSAPTLQSSSWTRGCPISSAKTH